KASHFDHKKFKDEYEDALKKLVRRKASGKTIEVPEREEKPDNVVSLMDALKQSLKTRGPARRSGGKSHARRAPQRRPPKRAHRSAARHRRAG
ncbi:MAG: Ku protein, partial [Bradyrhizobium sp.]|nr:Ku protein [Bradyrhizobium sp.]